MKWSLNQGKLIYAHPKQEIYFTMPKGFKMPSPALLELAELLIDPWSRREIKAERKKGSKDSVSFSTGVDSTVCALLMPDAVLSYMKRDFESQLIHDNALNMIKGMDRPVLVVPSNHELIRTYHGHRVGFSTDLACCVHLVLLADHLDLKSVAVGTVLESAYLHSGYKYRNFNLSSYFLMWTKVFSQAGLDLLFLTAGMSEVLTSKICSESKYGELAYSCLRKKGGCGNCYKCFRKNLLKGTVIPMDRETLTFLHKEPIKMASALLYGMKKNNLSHPLLVKHLEKDFSFLEKLNPQAVELVPDEYQSVFDGIETMNNEELLTLKRFKL